MRGRKPHARPLPETTPCKAVSQSETERRLRVSDAANAAALFVEAAAAAPEGETAVQTPYGAATVVKSSTGADVVLHGRDVTVHVRPE